MSQEQNKNIFGVPYKEITIKLDKETLSYLQKEAERTDLNPEIIAASFLRNDAKMRKMMDI